MPAHQALIAKVLKNLGHEIPDDNELDLALKKSFADLKKDEDVDETNVKYKLTLTPVQSDWVAETFKDR